jgi:hypothetical protein
MHGLIPVFGSVSAAYGFAFGRFLTLFRLSWLWLVASAAVMIAWGPEIQAAMREFEVSKNAEALNPVLPKIFGLGVVQFVAQVIVLVALLRAVISRNYRDGVPLHLLSGMPDLRLIGAAILLLIAFIAAGFAVGLIFGLVAAVAAAAGASALVAVAGVVLFAAALYVGLGLALVAPVASVEPTLGVERSWELMKGNRLRFFAASLLTFLPLGLALTAAFFVFVVPQVGPLPELAGLDQKAMQAAIQEYQAKVDAFLQQDYFLYAAGATVLTMISLGLQAGLLGHAYRCVTNMTNEEAE